MALDVAVADTEPTRADEPCDVAADLQRRRWQELVALAEQELQRQADDAVDERYACFDDPMEADRHWWETAMPEQQKYELNRCSDYMGSAWTWKVANGVCVVDREATERAMGAAVVRRSRLRTALSRARRGRTLAFRFRAMPRPRSSRRRPLRVRARGSSSASRDGPGEPEPPLSAPGSAGLVGSEVAA